MPPCRVLQCASAPSAATPLPPPFPRLHAVRSNPLLAAHLPCGAGAQSNGSASQEDAAHPRSPSLALDEPEVSQSPVAPPLPLSAFQVRCSPAFDVSREWGLDSSRSMERPILPNSRHVPNGLPRLPAEGLTQVRGGGQRVPAVAHRSPCCQRLRPAGARTAAGACTCVHVCACVRACAHARAGTPSARSGPAAQQGLRRGHGCMASCARRLRPSLPRVAAGVAPACDCNL